MVTRSGAARGSAEIASSAVEQTATTVMSASNSSVRRSALA